jgi:hypothetical protein
MTALFVEKEFKGQYLMCTDLLVIQLEHTLFLTCVLVIAYSL